MGSVIKSKQGDRQNEKGVQKPSQQRFYSVPEEHCHRSSIINSSNLTWIEGKVLVLVFVILRSIDSFSSLSLTPANYVSQAPLPTGFCQREALTEHWEEEGRKSQIIPLPFPAPPHTPSLTCASGPHQVPSSLGRGEHSPTTPLIQWGGAACCCYSSLC